MPLAVKINVALREQNCQKIGSERVKILKILHFKMYILHLLISHKCKFYTSKCKLNTFII